MIPTLKARSEGRLWRRLRWCLAAASASLALGAAPAASADQWFKTDTHVHSSAASGDAPQDLGVISAEAKLQGIDVVFLTDHTAASTQNIASVIANHPRFDDDISKWSQLNYSPTGTTSATSTGDPAAATLNGPTLASGNMLLCELGAPSTAAAGLSVSGPNSTTNEMVSMPTNTGTAALHLASTNSGYGETFAYLKRGPSLNAGNITLKFSVNPTRIDPGSGMYVSMSIGGDDGVAHRPPTGYTPQGGTPSLTKHTVLVWQVGNPRQDSPDPDARVITHQLPYMTGVWNTYTIDVSAALNEIPVADRPNDLDGLAILKMAAAGRGGSADGYFDTFSMDTAADKTQGQEFVYRNQHVHDYDTPTYKVYPGQEAGYQQHVQRFNFGITDPAQFTAWTNGPASVPSTQASGYPAQLDHPGLPGGVAFQQAIDTQGAGADAVETAERGEGGLVKNVMIDAWDGILKQGTQILGSWSSDAHKPDRFGPVTYMLSPSIGFDDLMRSYYEGRTYNALGDFTGRAIFNIDGSSTNPYPARYPVSVSPSQSLARVHFRISGGIPPGSHVIWTRNGDQVQTDTVEGSSYDSTTSFSLAGPWTYVRAELRDGNDTRLAMSQPIFFRDTTDATPVGMSFHTLGVTTPTGNGYTKTTTKGITSSSWDGLARRLTIGLTNPAGSLVEMRARTAAIDAQVVTVDGTPVPPAATRAAYDASTASSWWFDSATHILLVKARQTGGTGTVVVAFVPSADGTSPSQPTGLTAHAMSSKRVDLGWTASTGDVDGYTVFRDGVAVADTTSDATSYRDQGLTGGTHYTYTVDAFDAAENHSARSSPASATTDTAVTNTFVPVADSYVDDSLPTKKSGSNASLRIDGDPALRTYLRFDLSALPGRVEQARLRLFANSVAPGHLAHSADNNWTESTLTAANAPPPSTAVYGSGHVTDAGQWSITDVTPMITGNGTFTIVLDSELTSAMSFGSRESANPPQLVVDSSVRSNDPPVANNVPITSSGGAQVPWTPSVTDPDGDTFTCAIATQPAHGTATVATDCSGGTYKPTTGYSGSDTFTYTATDSRGATSNPATVTATVVNPNRAPTAADRSLTTAEDSGGSWTPSVADADGDATTCAITAQPAHGSATVASDCSAGTYTPAANFHGPDSFTYAATDSHNVQGASGTVSATVTAVNDPPTAANRTLTTPQDTAGSWTPSVGDADGDTLTCEIVAQPAHGSASVAADCSGGTYTPGSGYFGDDSFTYRSGDPSNAHSGAASVAVTVVSSNHAPTAANRSLSTPMSTDSTWTPSVSDADADALTCEIVSQPAHGSATVNPNCSTGSYSPAAGYYGDDSFTYRAVDSHNVPSNTATVSATVTVPTIFNDGFESGDLSAWSSKLGMTVQSAIVNTGSFAARAQSSAGPSGAKRTLGSSYTDVTYKLRYRTELATPTGNPTIMRLRTAADKALVTVYLNNARKVGVRNDIGAVAKVSSTALSVGQWYEIELHVIVNGAASTIEVRVNGVKLADISSTASSDLGSVGAGTLQIGENSATPTYDSLYDEVSAAVVTSNRSPSAADRSVSTPEDTLGNWTPSATDPDADPVTCAIVSQPAHGTATVASNCSSGTYAPASNYNGPDSFTYRATDSRGAQSSAATVSATVSPVNDSPTAAARSLTTAEDVQGSWTPSVNDADGDALGCTIVDQPAHGSATVNADCSGGTYTPAANYHGPDSFTYRAADPATAQSAPATVSATVTSVNDPPTAADRSLTTAQDVAGSWTPSVGDADGDAVTCEIVAQPAHGSASVSADCSGGSYTPAAGYSGDDSFTYRSVDSHSAASAPATVSATVISNNRAPTAADRSLSTAQDTAGSWTPSVGDPDGDAVTCEIVAQPAHGSASVSPDCSSGSYTPAAGYSGDDSFTYRSVDSHSAASAPATVSATVTPANRAPTAGDRSLTTNADTAGAWSPAVSDPDGDPVTCSIVSQPAHGTATVSTDCSGGTYTPAAGYSGGDTFTYRATDSHSADSAPGTVSATVVVPALFSDGFESGNLSAWSSSRAITVQSAIVSNGSFAARAQSSVGPAWAKRTLGGSYSDVTYRLRYRTELATPTGSPTIMRFRTPADKALATIYLAAGRKVGLRNDIASVAKASSTVLATGRWYDIELHAIANGAASTIEVRVDGVKLTDISTSPSDLGTAGIGSLQIGENNIGSAYDALYDDVVATRAVGPGTTAALRTAPRCTSGSSVRLSGPRRQHVARTGAVQIQALSASTCQVHAVAMVRSVRGRALVQSHSVTTVLPAGRRGALTLLFSPRGRQRIKRELGRRPVYVLVYAGSRTRPIAKRRVLATP